MTRAVISFVLLYFLLFGLSTLVMTGMGMDPLSGASAVAATLGNVGPGLGMVGPMENYAFLPGLGKVYLSLLMIVGRLENLQCLCPPGPQLLAGAGERRRGWFA